MFLLDYNLLCVFHITRISTSGEHPKNYIPFSREPLGEPPTYACPSHGAAAENSRRFMWLVLNSHSNLDEGGCHGLLGWL